MKKILVPTDFSQGSLRAANYALDLASQFNAEITLIWVNSGKLPSNDPTQEILDDGAKEHLSRIITELCPDHSIKIEAIIRHGKIHKEIANQAKYDNSDLVVCSTHGEGGLEKDEPGSHTLDIVSECPCPIVTVRPNYRINPQSHVIVLPIDSSTQTRQKVSMACSIALSTRSQIHVLGLFSSSLSSVHRKVEVFVQQVNSYIESCNIPHVVEFRECKNIAKGAVMYANAVNADLIAIMTEQEERTARFFYGSFANEMLKSAPMPVLSIHPNESMTITHRL